MHKNQSGFGAFGIILLFLLSLIVAYAGWHVYETQKQDADDSNAEQTSVAAKPKVTMRTETEAANGQIAYKNDTLGVSFSYPSRWGKEPQVKDAYETYPEYKGKVYEFRFDGQPLVKAGVMDRDYEAPGKDGGCYINLGLYPGQSIASLKKDITMGDTNYEGYKTTARLLSATADTYVFERFEAGEASGLGACPGISVNGFKEFPATSKFTGIQFIWTDETSAGVPAAQFESYKANPDAFITAENRDAFISTVKSAKPL